MKTQFIKTLVIIIELYSIISIKVIKKTKLGSLHFINTAQSLSILIESNGKYGLVDASNNYLYSEHEVEKLVVDPSKGEADKGTDKPEKSVQRVVDYLKAKGVQKLEFIIGTHSHNDHIGGIPAVAYYFVDNSTYYYYKEYQPTKEEKTTDWANPAYFRAAYDSMKIKGAKLIDVTDKSISFNLEQFSISLLHTESKDCYDYGENCFSITQLLTIGNNRIFLEADLSDKIDRKDPGKLGLIDIFGVGHHGLIGSASYELIKVIRPKVAIIPNDHLTEQGEAKSAFMENHFNTKVYMTSGAGHVIENAAVRVDLFEEGYELANTGDLIDITKFNGWKKWNDRKVYLTKGVFATGWQELEWSKGNDTFYFNEDGIMQTGWQNLEWKGGKDIFYFDPSDGYMLKNCCRVIDDVQYCFDENGVLIK